MKHLFSFLTIFLLLSGIAHAQVPNSWRIGFGINAGVATSDAFKYALGGDIRVQKNFNERLSGTLTTGFTHFFEKDHFASYNQYGSPYNVIPVKLGLKYFVTVITFTWAARQARALPLNNGEHRSYGRRPLGWPLKTGWISA
jgi:hypothetical protein